MIMIKVMNTPISDYGSHHSGPACTIAGSLTLMPCFEFLQFHICICYDEVKKNAYHKKRSNVLHVFHSFFFRLSGCNLSERSCEALASVVSSQSSSVRKLDLSNNNLQDSGVKLLAVQLENANCKVETFR